MRDQRPNPEGCNAAERSGASNGRSRVATASRCRSVGCAEFEINLEPYAAFLAHFFARKPAPLSTPQGYRLLLHNGA
jgi:hypothetical protein